MRILATAVLGLAAAASTQSPLPLGQPLTSPNNGNPGGAIFFDMTVTNTLTIDSLTYVASDVSNTGNCFFTMYFGPATANGNTATMAPWIEIAQSAPVPCAAGVDTTCVGVLTGTGANAGGTVTFAPGSYGICLVATGHSWGYQNGPGTTLTFGGAAPTSGAPNVDLEVRAGWATNAPFAGPTFFPRVINGQIDYTLGGTPIGAASKQDIGEGCYASYQSFLEEFANPATGQDLSNSSIYLAFNGNGYDVTTGTTAVAPTGAGAQVVTFADDNTAAQVLLSAPINYVAAGGLTQSPIDPVSGMSFAQMSPEPFVVLDAGPCTGGNPVRADKFATDGTSVGLHVNCDSATGGGTCTYEFDLVTADQIFTWNAVPSNTLASTNTVQVVFFANLDIEIRLGALDLAIGGGWPTICGYITGNGALDPGDTDISVEGAAPGFSTGAFDQDPLTLEADVVPALGTTVNMTTSALPAGSAVGLCIFSLSANTTGVPGFLFGAPGCTAYINTIDVPVVQAAPALTTALPLPNDPTLVGLTLGVQSAFLQAPLDPFLNGLGIALSNGVLLILGN